MIAAINFTEKTRQIARDRDKKNYAKLNTTVVCIFSSFAYFFCV